MTTTAGAATAASAPHRQHPLDPLTADELAATVAVLRHEKGVDERWRYATIDLVEPAKDVVRGHRSGDPVTRSSRSLVWSRDDRVTHIAVVDLDAGTVTGWTPVPGVQPNMTVDEFHEAHDAMIAHPDVLAALARRGVTDPSLVLVDTWTYGHALIPAAHRERRVGWTDLWVRETPGGNPYARPLNGLHLVLDLDTMELLDIEDTHEVEQPASMGEYDPALVPGLLLREPLKPFEVTQPEGVSFTLDGYELSWQGWSMRLGFTTREGLVLHRIAYDDPQRPDADGAPTRRPIAHRISFAEMVVPYRDPTTDHSRRTAFDIGEWGLGYMTTSLELGCDCLGEIRYLDAVVPDSRGAAQTIKNAICLHEEDDGVLWKHVDDHAGAQVRRSRRMVVSFHATVANYEYLVYWRFYQDGTIECEVRATGIMVTTALPEGETSPYGPIVDERTYAPIHQHFIVARLDMEVDGPGNTVVETGTEALPISSDNPHGLAVVQRSRPLRTEREGQRDPDPATQRSWKVTNPSSLNRHGSPVAWKLAPSASFPAMFSPDAPVLQRAQVIRHALWVTPFADDERWPAGEFVNQSAADTGLPVWTAADRSIEDTDLVLWHVFGIHHVPRPEDWPVMPVDVVRFELKPVGFFDRNPALDVPPTTTPAGGAHCH